MIQKNVFSLKFLWGFFHHSSLIKPADNLKRDRTFVSLFMSLTILVFVSSLVPSGFVWFALPIILGQPGLSRLQKANVEFLHYIPLERLQYPSYVQHNKEVTGSEAAVGVLPLQF